MPDKKNPESPDKTEGTTTVDDKSSATPPKTPRKKANAQKPAKSLEQTLWDAADKLRGNLESSEYKHVVLGLVFLKYVSDAFTERREFLRQASLIAAVAMPPVVWPTNISA